MASMVAAIHGVFSYSRIVEKVSVPVVREEHRLVPESATAVSEARKWSGSFGFARRGPVHSYSTASFMVRSSDGLAFLVRSVSVFLQCSAMPRGPLGKPKQPSSVLKEDQQRASHGGDGAHGPELVKHDPHDNEGQQDSDQAVTRRSQFRRSRGSLECH